ncbi:hypothetical protein PVAND_000303 [Polypedilum vanderplanki]|uniref:Plus3 domain-containing protein n=1 Tax=Polypedilum vanderplanki TaxID=319348 RepID=A0A9J6BJX8_POLVA|nr:hypothetical protein PVAND_000303 [Polypedilum vanderplanki]
MKNQEEENFASKFDSSSSESEFNDGYESDLMAGEHDRTMLQMMSEKERETELFKRGERRDMLKRQWEIKKKIKQAKKKEGVQVTEEQQKNRTIDRKKKIEVTKIEVKRNNALAQLKAEREVKSQKKEPANEINFYEDVNFINDKNESSENALENYHPELTNFQPILISTLKELNELQVKRHIFEKIINNPLFDKIIIGLYIRANVGKPNQVNPYRVAQIVGVSDGAKVYNFGNKCIKKVLKLRISNKNEILRLEYISNQSFEKHEFLEWIKFCKMNGNELPRIDQIKDKDKKIAMILDVRKELNKPETTEKESSRIINFAMKKRNLMTEREIAMSDCDIERMTEIDEEIKILNEQAEEIEKIRTASIRNIAYINERNRRLNILDSEISIREDMRIKEAQKSKGESWDPFIRRTTKPSIPFKTFNPEINNEAVVISDNVPKISNPQIISQNLIESAKTPKVDMNMYELHDFEIDIDIDMTNQPPSLDRITLPPINPPSQNPLPYGWRKWEEFKNKNGII